MVPERGIVCVPKAPELDPLAEIEKTQNQLRENIEESKQLCEKTQQLLKQAKKDQALDPGSGE
jgi:hypothetical protein